MKKFVFFVFFFSILSAIALELPKDPHVFYGTVKLNNNAVSGVLRLYVNGVYQDQITVVNGKFGGSGVFDSKLTATGKNGDNITFELVVNCYSTNKITKTYQEGKVEEITLSFTGTYSCGTIDTTQGTTSGTSSAAESTPTTSQQPTKKDEILNQLIDKVTNKEALKEIINTYAPILETLIENQIKNIQVIEDKNTIQQLVGNANVNLVLKVPLQESTIDHSTILTKSTENQIIQALKTTLGKEYTIVPITTKTRTTMLLAKSDNEITFLRYEVETNEKKVVVNIPKTLAETTDYIIGNFKVIQKDPIIMFENQPKIEFLIKVPKSEITKKMQEVSKVVITKAIELQPTEEIKPIDQPKDQPREEKKEETTQQEQPKIQQSEIPIPEVRKEEKSNKIIFLILILVVVGIVLATIILRKPKKK
ncbi:MAG: hypothetical protein QXR30_03570 [Candidatus Woesearchaeota archaeon]